MLKYILFSACLSVCLPLTACDDKEDGSCEWRGLKGQCVPPRVCLTSLDKKSEQAPACPDKNGEATICCTDCELVNDTSNFIMSPSSGVFWKDGRKARDACLQYLKDVPNKCSQEGYYTGLSRYLNEERNCHVYSMWGIGGAPGPGVEPPSENPYEALLGFGDDQETVQYLSAGAIISEKFILTAAHATSSGDLPLKFVAVGVKNRKNKKDIQVHAVKKIYLHPEFKDRYSDIALIELEEPISFNIDVLPACLPEPTEEFDFSKAKFSSWKDKNTDAHSFLDSSNIINVQRLSAEECDVKISELDAASYNKYLPEKVKSDSQLCYGTKDTCLNIPGGPIAVMTQYTRCMNTVVGVNAYGESCAPTVFTKVVHFTPWIENIVWP